MYLYPNDRFQPTVEGGEEIDRIERAVVAVGLM
jgi:hypothetical protein